MVDQRKVQAVVAHFEGEFPGCSIEEKQDPDQRLVRFAIINGSSRYRAMITYEFLEDHKAEDIAPLLRMFLLAEHLRELPSTPLVVTNRGLKLEQE